jgi:hypothetical protein
MQHKLAIIYWTDASIETTNQDTREEWVKSAKLIDGIAIGHILHENKRKITLGMDYFPSSDSYRLVATYPKSGIHKIIRKKVKV